MYRRETTGAREAREKEYEETPAGYVNSPHSRSSPTTT